RAYAPGAPDPQLAFAGLGRAPAPGVYMPVGAGALPPPPSRAGLWVLVIGGLVVLGVVALVAIKIASDALVGSATPVVANTGPPVGPAVGVGPASPRSSASPAGAGPGPAPKPTATGRLADQAEAQAALAAVAATAQNCKKAGGPTGTGSAQVA